MGIYRCFIEKEGFSEGDSIEIAGDEFHHLRSVLRLEVGDSVSLTNGRGVVADATVIDVRKKSCVIRVRSVRRESRGDRRVVLGLALLKPGHLDIAIEKATELGIDRFVIFRADRSKRDEITPAMQRRIEALITAAMKQCGRAFRPEVFVARSLNEAVEALEGTILWTDLGGTRRLEEALRSIEGSVSVLIGPEAGWSDGERQLLQLKSHPVLLHHNVLRAETAAIAASFACTCSK